MSGGFVLQEGFVILQDVNAVSKEPHHTAARECSLGDVTLPELGPALKATVLDSKLRIGKIASLLNVTNVGGGADVPLGVRPPPSLPPHAEVRLMSMCEAARRCCSYGTPFRGPSVELDDTPGSRP